MGELVLEEMACVKSVGGRGTAVEKRFLLPQSYCSEMIIVA